MNIYCRILLGFVGLNGALATGLAAAASHSAVMVANPYLTQVFAKASTMHFYHLLALLGLAAWYQLTGARRWLVSAGFFALGITLFCGPLYLFSFGGAKIAGILTPIGGACFILGWLALLLAAVFNNKVTSRES
ncbi:MAG: DUF423 domain-containing protein [Gammaproteobacteria bacterium]|nr:DUF423 domain-containing protein [Gammaproteobacteria bacterium]